MVGTSPTMTKEMNAGPDNIPWAALVMLAYMSGSRTAALPHAMPSPVRISCQAS
jgi:hypothetical protein